jgi:hypothetical protein
MKKVDAFYDCRSTAVHSGQLIDDQKTHTSLDDGEELIVNAVRKILDSGTFPNWSSLVLGESYTPESG